MDSVSLMMRNKSEVKLKAVVILVLKGISKLGFKAVNCSLGIPDSASLFFRFTIWNML